MAEGRYREVPDVGGNRFGVGDDSGAVFQKKVVGESAVGFDFGIGEGPSFGYMQTVGRKERLPDIAFADHDSEGRIDMFVAVFRFELLNSNSHFSENRVLFVSGLRAELRVAFTAKLFAEASIGGRVV